MRDGRRNEVIALATKLFNTHGIGAVGLTEIADKLDMSRASLYHYVKNRNDLIYQSYKRSCDQMAMDLEEADQSLQGFLKIKSYIECAMRPDHSPAAVLSEVASLDEVERNTIQNDHQKNIDHLIGFVVQGIEDESIKPCDPEIAAQAIYGIISWSQLLSEWSKSSTASSLRSRTVTTLIHLLEDGLATEPEKPLANAPPISRFYPTFGDPFEPNASADAKAESVLATASSLFNQNGIDSTSLNDIAASLGVTKGVLYHYFEDKDEIVLKSYERAFELYEAFICYAQNSSGTGLQIGLLNSHLNIQAKSSSLAPLMPQVGFSSLPTTSRQKFRKIANRQNKTIAAMLSAGIEDGSVRECETSLVTHIFAGAFGWIPKWRLEDDPRSPQVLADEMCRIIQTGLAR